ncbi:MAG: protein kinase domain-containing protein [Dermatophilaceae bacterium]
MTPTSGTTLGGRYTLLDHVASGGMGDVWTATDAVLGRSVAVKVLRPNPEPTFAERFRDEARHAAALSHPNISTVYDYGEDEGAAYLVMEYVVGRPLSELIAGGPMPPEQVRVIAGQAALALASAHEAGVVHRDVKPANILVTPEGQVKLTDFGIAHAADSAAHTRTGEVLGTPQYLSPEQALGRTVTGATDLYSLGVVAHEMLTGRRPFDAGSAVATALAQVNDPPPPLPAYVRDPLRSAVESCLAKDPAERPSSAASLAALLGMPVSGLGSTLPATSVIATTDLPMTQPMGAAAATTVLPPTGPVPGSPPATGALTEPKQPQKGKKGLGWWWLAIAAGVVAVGFLLFQLRPKDTATPAVTPTVTVTQQTTTTTTVTRTSSPTSAAPTAALISSADYVGKDVTAARNSLTKAGFTSVRVVEQTSDQKAGTVLAISPVGTVALTETITLTVSSGAPTTTAATGTGTNG